MKRQLPNPLDHLTDDQVVGLWNLLEDITAYLWEQYDKTLVKACTTDEEFQRYLDREAAREQLGDEPFNDDIPF